MRNILVSACLLGVKCRYDGRSCPNDDVLSLLGKANLIPVCAEILGGLPTPRVPAEIVGGRAVRKDGVDVTDEYVRGADEVVRIAKLYGCTAAILKERSPSCGKGTVYDGSFTGKLTEGNGITADVLMKCGISVYGESEIELIAELLK